MLQIPFTGLLVSLIQFPLWNKCFPPSHHRHLLENQVSSPKYKKARKTLPGRVPPAFRAQGADIVSVQQKSGGSRTSKQRQQADVALGGQESGKAAGHGVHREEGQVARTRWSRASDGMTERKGRWRQGSHARTGRRRKIKAGFKIKAGQWRTV